MKADVIVIGGGLSGLAAGIRLAYGGRKVLVFEKHFAPGGLNGFYSRKEGIVDVGLHAMTNFASDSSRTAPLNQLLRQLKLKRETLELCPQKESLILFPKHQLRLTNDITALVSQLEQEFPEEVTGFRRLLECVEGVPYGSQEYAGKMAREELRKFLNSNELCNMILCPVMLYGNPCQQDMDFAQFITMFRSIFVEGMGRPKQGMKPFILRLVDKLREFGGELFLSDGIVRMNGDNSRLLSVVDERGEEHQATAYISSVGAVETNTLYPGAVSSDVQAGTMGFIEGIYQLDCHPASLGVHPSVIFWNRKDEFDFQTTETVNEDTHIICMPGNFVGCEEIPSAHSIRISSMTSPDWWRSLSSEQYRKEKQVVASRMLADVESFCPGISNHLVSCEVATPNTITRFTGHINGAIYGAPQKTFSGKTNLSNLFLCGTDQGFLGIVGSLMSGTVMANQIELGMMRH